jgi:predicted ATPase
VDHGARSGLGFIPPTYSDRYYEPEVHRLRGELLLAASADAVAEAEAAIRTAIDLARAMDARSLELRATLSLARILTGRGERTAAQIAIDAVYKRFEEGFTTADLRDAEARRRE